MLVTIRAFELFMLRLGPGVLVVSLSSVNCRFWSHLGIQDRKPIYLLIQVLLRVDSERKLKI